MLLGSRLSPKPAAEIRETGVPEAEAPEAEAPEAEAPEAEAPEAERWLPGDG
jgi:hypothetical protein